MRPVWFLPLVKRWLLGSGQVTTLGGPRENADHSNGFLVSRRHTHVVVALASMPGAWLGWREEGVLGRGPKQLPRSPQVLDMDLPWPKLQQTRELRVPNGGWYRDRASGQLEASSTAIAKTYERSVRRMTSLLAAR